jgi:prephenate dehydratase
MKIGYQGLPGAYSEMASEKYVKSNKFKETELVGCESFEEIFQKVEDKTFEFGVVPVENSLAGSIYKNFDLLGKHNLKVVGEVYVHVNHQLCVLNTTKKEDVKEVYSHWQALAQCEHSLKKLLPNTKIVEYYDTAASSKYVKETCDKSKAAISSIKAAKEYKLKVLYKNIQDDKSNYTRFLVIGRDYAKSSNKKPKNFYKTSVIFAGKNVTGFLFKALACFSLRDINLSKIESRPIPKSPWGYYFYIDFEGKYDDENVSHAIKNLEEISSYLKVLGSYQASRI